MVISILEPEMMMKSVTWAVGTMLCAAIPLFGCLNHHLSSRYISTAEAAALVGSFAPQTFEGKVCVSNDDCVADNCSTGGAVSCSLHKVIVPTEETQWFSTRKCSSFIVEECDCVRSNLFYTCSSTIAACVWDETDEECKEVATAVINQNAKTCKTLCEPVGGN